MSNIIPLRLRPHLINYLMTEMNGEEKTFAGYKCKTIEIPKLSPVGRFIIDRLVKTDYPVKDISSFNFFADIKNISRKRWVAAGRAYKVENFKRSFVMLPETYAEEVNDLLEHHFRTAFYYYVQGRGDQGEKITRSIIGFIEKYDLYEAGISDIQLRKLYYRMKSSGTMSALQGKLSRK